MSAPAVRRTSVVRMGPGATERTDDLVAVERPLEIRLRARTATSAGTELHRLGVTMRTPGDDVDLVIGFLAAEGLVARAADVADVRPTPIQGGGGDPDALVVDLADDVVVDATRLDRQRVTSSACGACGAGDADGLVVPPHHPLPAGPTLDPDVVAELPDRLRDAQPGFDRTGGLHASGLFSPVGDLLAVREDVGRHNALDKLLGARLRDPALGLADAVVVVSSRASFELVQKAVMAGVGVLAAVGAPTSMAVDVARAHGLTLLAFVRDGRVGVYSHPERVRGAADVR